MKPVRTLVVITDGAKAIFYRNDGPGKGLVALDQHKMTQDVPPSRDLTSDRPGRSFDSSGPHRSAMEPKTDPHDLEEAKFAGGVLERTEELMNAGEAEKLILVAAPKTLGEMRKSMPRALADRLTATLDKDLTRTPAPDLPKHLEGVLAV
ncbi:MAG TPA: host attachment protein, partial [Rhizobiaceae bacterium]|nr:host attachment protein [Rhizobiaceae bacterium]